MTEATDPAMLGDHPFLRSLTAAQIERLAPCAREAGYAEGAFIFREGGGADTVHLVRSGSVALEQHVPGRGVVTVETLGPGDVLGLSWLYPPARWTLDARCIEPVQTFALGADCVRACMANDQPLGLELLGHMVHALYQRLIRVRLQRLDVYNAGT